MLRKYWGLWVVGLPVLDVPGHCTDAQEAANVGATAIVDVPWEPKAEIVREGNAICADVGLLSLAMAPGKGSNRDLTPTTAKAQQSAAKNWAATVISLTRSINKSIAKAYQHGFPTARRHTAGSKHLRPAHRI